MDNNIGVSITIPGNPYLERIVPNSLDLRENIFFGLNVVKRFRNKAV
jgi:hypothetical protein